MIFQETKSQNCKASGNVINQLFGQTMGAGGPRGATPCSRSGGGVVRRYPSSKVRNSAALCWSSHEEIPQVQGKRNPSKMVGTEKGHQWADRWKPQSQTTGQSDHMDHSLV